MFKLLLTMFGFFILLACETFPESISSNSINSKSALPDSFSTANIMAVRQGMTSKDILEIFGPPENINVTVCGSINKWNCTTWEYGKFPYEQATFTFSVENDNLLLLNNFKVKRN